MTEPVQPYVSRDESDPVSPYVVRCTSCGQEDNHPKMHHGDTHAHFDCIPDDVRADAYGHLEGAEKARVDQVIAHAHGDGVEHLHGHDLRVKHVELDPNQPAHVKQALGLTVSTAKGGKSHG